MNAYPDFSPVSLSYVAALRGVRPRQPGDAFTYAVANCADPDMLVCLAASNPEGRFIGLVASPGSKADGERLARERQVGNVAFLDGRLAEYLLQGEKGASPIPPLDYLCCEEKAVLSEADRNALFALAEKLLLPGGLFAYSYRAYDKEDGALRFLVREFAPEMDAIQAKEFLQELKMLGGFYFAAHPDIEAKLDQAYARGVPDQFFMNYDEGEARSGTFDTIVNLGPRGFMYVGDADIGLNYIELAAPVAAHKIIVDCRSNYLYEPIKDFALNRQTHCDIWCRQPSPMTLEPAALFGAFVYGITMPRSEVPAQVKTHGNSINLGAPLFAKLIDLMTVMPASIGDFLAHTDGKDYAPKDVVAAIQILVACGIARPMRGHYRSAGLETIAQPRLVGGFNQYLDKTAVTHADIWLASPVTGCAVSVTARDALVMQALNRAGLANSVSALLPELERLSRDPASAAGVLNATEPTPEMAADMIKDTVSQSIIQWYAYGLLAAA